MVFPPLPLVKRPQKRIKHCSNENDINVLFFANNADDSVGEQKLWRKQGRPVDADLSLQIQATINISVRSRITRDASEDVFKKIASQIRQVRFKTQ